MDVLISRQDAIAKFKKTCTYELIDKNGIKRGEIHSAMAYEKIIKIIESLPSAEPERKWIPVTEALPKPWQEVLTTYEYNGKRFVQTAEYAGQNDEKGNPLFCACSDEFAPYHYDFVYVAWQPLPEPWRGE